MAPGLGAWVVAGRRDLEAGRFDHLLRQVLVVPVLAILLGAGAFLWQMRDADRTVNLIEKTDAVLAQTLLVERLILDQETGLRGYQTTGNAVFLGSYDDARVDLPGELTRLEEEGDARQGDTVRGLETLHDGWEQGFAVPLIATIQAGGQTNASDLNLQGKAQMDGMRRTLARLTREDDARRAAAIREWQRQVRRMGLALLGLAGVVGLAIGMYTRSLLKDVSEAFRRGNHILRIRAEEAFRREQRLRTTLASIADGVISCDAEGRVQMMNAVAQELTGVTQEDAAGKPLEEVLRLVSEGSGEVRESAVKRIRRLNKAVTLGTNTLLVRKDGVEIPIEDSGAPIRDKHGAMMGFVLVFRDVTVARRQQQALVANEKLAVAGRLAATIAHEIHNPLDSVANLLYLMGGPSTAEEQAHFLELARGEIERVTQISRAMLSLYREARAPVGVDLKEMLESILLLLDRRFQDLGVSVRTELPERLVVHGFPAELRQVFTNLLTNAAEAAGKDGLVQVGAALHERNSAETRGLERGVMVTVHDDGPGIEAAVRPRLFQPFFTTKGEQGTGLGLWVSRGIVHKHGGVIEVESSTGAEHGTTVSVFLAVEPRMHTAVEQG